jgi:hypothetical protein
MVEEIGGFRVKGKEPAAHRVARGVLGAEFSLFEPDACAFRELFGGGGKIEVFVVSDERDDISAGAASEAFKDLKARIDAEGGGAFLMKRAERLEESPGAAQGEIAADDIDDVIGGNDLIEGFRRNEGHNGEMTKSE